MRFRIVVLVAMLGLVAAACSDDGGVELSTTSSLVTGTTSPPSDNATTTVGDDDPGSTTPTTLVGETVTSFEVVARLSDDNGETLHILIPGGAYTDVDLENFVGDLKDGDPELWGAEVFDDPDAIDAYVIPEEQRTGEQQELVSTHHFVSLVNGDTIVYRGPFSEFGQILIGS